MKELRHVLISAGIAAVLMLGALAVHNDYLLRIGFMICIYYLCAAGMNVLVGFAGQKSLGQAGLFAAGAYSVALLTTTTDMSPWLALVLAVVISALCGVLIALPSLRAKGPYLAMVTSAFGLVVEKLVSGWTEVFGGTQGIFGVRSLGFGDQAFSMTQWICFAIGLCLVVHLLLRNVLSGRFGRSLLSVQADEIAAASVGIRVYRAKVMAFVVAAVTCGLAGALVAQQNQYINSDFISFQLSIFILLLVLFGGSGTYMGPIVGAVVLTLIDAFLARWPSAQHFIYGALLLLALYAMPGGVAGAIGRWLPRRTAPGLIPGGVPQSLAQGGTSELLVVQGVSKAYGGVRPARDISFRLTRGHVHALIGPNGAGKTTMINMLSGIVRPDAGSIRFLGQEAVGQEAHVIAALGMGRTFQNLRLFAELSVLDNVMLGRHAHMTNGFWKSLFATPMARRQEVAARASAASILRFVGLSEVAHTAAGSLPYGLQRRAELARALATEPQLLLLDEPAAGLNPHETAELGQLLVAISRRGVTILMVEHHMDLVMSISDHVVVLDYGVKIAEGPPQQIRSDPRVIEAYLGADVEEEEAA